jgi:hypothetical protein
MPVTASFKGNVFYNLFSNLITVHVLSENSAALIESEWKRELIHSNFEAWNTM